MEKCKRMEIRLPEAMIHLIQSFLSEEEAARTTLISKSWYNAWLTRPVLVLRHFHRRSAEFSEFAVKTLRRYQDSNLKIESLRLKMPRCTITDCTVEPLARRLIVDAMKMGATDLNLEFIPPTFVPTMWMPTIVMPQEVLGSETLLRLSLCGCEIDGNVNCSMLKSLSLDRVHLKSADLLESITSCCNSIEELSLSNSYDISNNISNYRTLLSGKNIHELHKLKRLYLEMVIVCNSFFDNLESRFPCLEDMSLVLCSCPPTLLTSSSLKRISMVQCLASRIEFEVPNLAIFSYSADKHVLSSIISISIKARDEWESHISMECHHFRISSSWYRDLHKLLTQLSSSRINLAINIGSGSVSDILGAVAKPVAVENLRVEAEYVVGRIIRCLYRYMSPQVGNSLLA
ncbi:putative F-box/FBD/LRR-repeat protein At1g66290 isoform X2 [Salvia miltiorrhiza]|nr:putative F-box/FBD/LRR-repeat protein At1g66290 isoform X2 [Salvia miltiorrhiza]